MESFDVRMLDDPNATLLVIAPNTGTVAGAAVALIDSIIRYFRRKMANHQLTHRLLLELDEVCNACPLPDLLTYVGESAGLGVNILATVQASSHFDVVYGPKYADALRDMFPGTLIMYGAHERHLLEQASHWLGETTRRTESSTPAAAAAASHRSSGKPSAGRSCSRRPGRKRSCCKGELPGSAFIFLTGAEFQGVYDQAVAQRLRRTC